MDCIKDFKTRHGNRAKIGFIGCGNMAYAIVKGILDSKLFDAKDIVISGRNESSFENWKPLNVEMTLDNRKLANECAIVFLCVKPNCLDGVAESLKQPDRGSSYAEFDNETKSSGTLVSILAGTSIEKIKKKLPLYSSYIRAMPNTPLQVQAGCTALTNPVMGKYPNNEKDDLLHLNFIIVETIFSSLGIAEVVDESKFDAVTAVSGSGPAYVYIMIEALSDAGVKQGLPRDIATKFAAQTLFGASKTVLSTGQHPGVLKDQVTSSGGTTIYGIHELEKGGIRNTLINAVQAATQRSKEMS